LAPSPPEAHGDPRGALDPLSRAFTAPSPLPSKKGPQPPLSKTFYLKIEREGPKKPRFNPRPIPEYPHDRSPPAPCNEASAPSFIVSPGQGSSLRSDPCGAAPMKRSFPPGEQALTSGDFPTPRSACRHSSTFPSPAAPHHGAPWEATSSDLSSTAGEVSPQGDREG
jgi:hypothetical protein